MANVEFNIARTLQATSKALGAGLAAGAITAQAEMKRMLGQPGTGRVYRRRTKKATYHTASAPGKFPALNLGDYRRSIQVDLSQIGAKKPKSFVGTNSKVGPWLEFGTRHMAPRPHWRVLFTGKRRTRIENAVAITAAKKFRTETAGL